MSVGGVGFLLLLSQPVWAFHPMASTSEADQRVDWTFPEREAPQAVVNGVESDWIGVVSLVAVDSNSGSGGPFCSATHISKRWLLTAAHCVDAMSNEYAGYTIYAFYGDDIYTGIGERFVVTESVTHPDWEPDLLINDLGLVRIGRDRPGWGQAVVNASSVRDEWAGESFTFVGYGVTVDEGADGGVKRQTDIEFQGCFDPVSGVEQSCSEVDALVMYSESSDTNVCSGDSGGPVFRQTSEGPLFVGVNSFVTPGCVGGGTGSARVDLGLDWIQSYEPNVYTDFGQVVDEPVDSPSDTGEIVPPGDGDGPARPQPGDYERPVFGMCTVAGASSSLAWPFILVLLLPLSRRRY